MSACSERLCEEGRIRWGFYRMVSKHKHKLPLSWSPLCLIIDRGGKVSFNNCYWGARCGGETFERCKASYPSLFKEPGVTDFRIVFPSAFGWCLCWAHIYQARHCLPSQLTVCNMGKRSRGRLKPEECRAECKAESTQLLSDSPTQQQPGCAYGFSGFALCNQVIKHDAQPPVFRDSPVNIF